MLKLELGASGPLHVRHEPVDLGLSHPVRVLYASDLHLGHFWTRGVASQLVDACRQEHPDVILLGGDLVDARSALPVLSACIRQLAALAAVAAVPGNHDAWVGLAAVRDAVTGAGGRWLPDERLREPLPIDGVVASSKKGPEARLLCTHHPKVFPRAASAGYGLVLAGHLHGGQCVLAQAGGLQYPAVWLHRWHGLRFSEGSSTMLVSRGAADTLPLRLGCPREVILCDIR